MADPKKTDTGELRDSVDEGRTAEKTPWPDPATAPRQTGAEAAGYPTPEPEAEADRERQEEIARNFDRHVEPMSAAATPARKLMNRRFAVWLGVVLAVVVVVAFLVAGGTAPD